MADNTKKKKKMGRPTVMTPERLSKLEDAFCWEWSDQKACDYAGISVEAFYAYQRKNPDFKHRKEMLRNHPKEVAKRNISKAIDNGDLKTSQWFLERRDNEYSLKKQVDVNVQHRLDEGEIKERLLQLIEKTQQNKQDEDVIDVEPEIKKLPNTPDSQ